jgi:prepilin-type N-terminal cleavage/methylation domain-containing protein
MARPARGFSLIEMAVVLFVVTLLIGSLLVPLATQVEQRQISETQKALEEIREALLGFAVANGYLPCPDKTVGGGAGIANDGVEDWSGAACVAPNEGNVPWVTLGVGGSDPWGNRFRYQVSALYAQRPNTFTLSSAAAIQVCTVAACTPANTQLTSASPNGAVAVIISLGKNGFGAINAVTGTANPAPFSPDENQNLSGPNTFVSRNMTTAGTAVGEFDDIVIWLSKHTLFNRMVAAGKLP